MAHIEKFIAELYSVIPRSKITDKQ